MRSLKCVWEGTGGGCGFLFCFFLQSLVPFQPHIKLALRDAEDCFPY